mmetsp:Transcript_20390/g.50058  ORF Transcript_20390/g.50058 Transcript_20390/m.50058 type:complete len:94 (+) Transcript_20390:176-457(+)
MIWYVARVASYRKIYSELLSDHDKERGHTCVHDVEVDDRENECEDKSDKAFLKAQEIQSIDVDVEEELHAVSISEYDNYSIEKRDRVFGPWPV